MHARYNWIASILALLISLGVIAGTFVFRWDGLVESLRPEIEEENLEPGSILYWDRYFAHLEGLEKELQSERETLAEERAALDEMKAQVARRSEEIDRQSRDLEASRDTIRSWFLTYGDQQKENYQRVARTYAAMEPARVVPILLATPPEDVAKVLFEMKPDVVAAIWTAMIEASNDTEANAARVARLIHLMGRIHAGADPGLDLPLDRTTSWALPMRPDAQGERLGDLRLSRVRVQP